MWSFLSRNRDAGLLFLRLALGGFFIYAHGWAKLAGGVKLWHDIGMTMKHVGINFWPEFWGFMATMAETACVALVMIGLAFRPACLLVSFTMGMAGLHMWLSAKTHAEAIGAASHAWELGIVFLAMIFIGPGKYSVDKQ